MYLVPTSDHLPLCHCSPCVPLGMHALAVLRRRVWTVDPTLPWPVAPPSPPCPTSGCRAPAPALLSHPASALVLALALVLVLVLVLVSEATDLLQALATLGASPARPPSGVPCWLGWPPL